MIDDARPAGEAGRSGRERAAHHRDARREPGDRPDGHGRGARDHEDARREPATSRAAEIARLAEQARLAQAARERRGTSGDREHEPGPGRPAGFCHGAGHRIVYGNPSFIRAFGEAAVGLPPREALVTLPAEAFRLFDAVFERGRPLARWIAIGTGEWRLTVAPRRDVGTGEVYGVAFHLRDRGDLPIVRGEMPDA